MTQLQIDALPKDPAGSQAFARITGLDIGDKAAVVLDIGALPKPLKVLRAGALFAGGTSCIFGVPQAATANVEIYDGVTFNGAGNALLGPLIYSSPAPVSLAVDTFTSVDIAAANVVANGSKLVVAFEIVTNPNEFIPGLPEWGYCANLVSDTQLASTSPCATGQGSNLIYDSVNTNAWWDVTAFNIGGVPWCGASIGTTGSYNGNWVIRACVETPAGAYVGSGEDLVLASGVGGAAPDAVVAKSVTAGDAVQFVMTSPGGTFVPGISLIVLDGFASVGPAPIPVAPSTWVGPNFVIAGPYLLLAPGVGLPLTMPPGLAGATFVFQGVVLSDQAANGIYATTDAHALWIY